MYLFRQVRKPSRYIGRFFTWVMNRSHSPLTDWALSFIEIPPNATVLDVGCGGGKTIEKLAARASSVYGIDYAPGSVASSRAHNKQEIAEGRVCVQEASVSQLPFAGNFFDLATAIETHFYWPDPVNDLREIRRVLKPGARVLIVAESYKGAGNDWLLGFVMRLLGSHRLTLDQHRQLFEDAGYTEVEIIEERKKGWLRAIGRKPSSES